MRTDLLRKISDASLVKRYERGVSEWDETKGTDDFILNPLEAMDLTSNQSSSNGAVASTIKIHHESKGDMTESNMRSQYNYPSWNYLTLRHEQNSAWAQLQFEKGIKHAKEALNPSCTQTSNHDLATKAEGYYKEGLEMVPHHTRLLTAYGALCINNGKWEMAHDLLSKAIRLLQHESTTQSSSDDKIIDNDTLKDAKTYFTVVESKLHAKAKAHAQAKQGQVHLSNKAEQAMNDALAERAFSMGNDAAKISSKHCKASVSARKRGSFGQSDEYQLLSSSSSSSSESEEESTRRRRKKDKRRKRHKREMKNSSSQQMRDRDSDSKRSCKKRRDRYETRSEDEIHNDTDRNYASLESSDSGSNARGRRQRRKKRHRRKRKSTSRRERSRSKSRGRSRSNTKSRSSLSTQIVEGAGDHTL